LRPGSPRFPLLHRSRGVLVDVGRVLRARRAKRVVAVERPANPAERHPRCIRGGRRYCGRRAPHIASNPPRTAWMLGVDIRARVALSRECASLVRTDGGSVERHRHGHVGRARRIRRQRSRARVCRIGRHVRGGISRARVVARARALDPRRIIGRLAVGIARAIRGRERSAYRSHREERGSRQAGSDRWPWADFDTRGRAAERADRVASFDVTRAPRTRPELRTHDAHPARTATFDRFMGKHLRCRRHPRSIALHSCRRRPGLTSSPRNSRRIH